MREKIKVSIVRIKFTQKLMQSKEHTSNKKTDTPFIPVNACFLDYKCNYFQP